MRIRPGVREILAATAARRVSGALVAVIVAVAVASILLSAGQATGARALTLQRLDATGSRTIVVTLTPAAGVDSKLITRLSSIDDIEWAAALGPAVDVRNPLIPDGRRVALRPMWMRTPATRPPRASQALGLPPVVVATPDALRALSLRDGIGSVRGDDDLEHLVTGLFAAHAYLERLGPLLLQPVEPSTVGPVTSLVVVAARPQVVGALTRALTTLVGSASRADVRIETSEQIADVQGALAHDLARSSTVVIGVASGASMVLIIGLVAGTVVLGRREFGRRRALGAPRSFIVLLVTGQTAVAALLGSVAGGAGGLAGLAFTRNPLPDAEFSLASLSLGLGAAVASALPGAIFACSRQPAAELRVP